MMTPSTPEIIGTLTFFLAILHTFCAKFFHQKASKLAKYPSFQNLFYYLGEVEIVFGLWAAVFTLICMCFVGRNTTLLYLDHLNFTEPLFVFAIMTVAASKPITEFAQTTLTLIVKFLPFSESVSFYATALSIGPIMGSFITEPAAMTVTAILLKNRFFAKNLSSRFTYLTLGVLFVNISIGGVLTSFAAPPVLMVARIWNWNSSFMMGHFGWKALIAIGLNTLFAIVLGYKELKKIQPLQRSELTVHSPFWLKSTHLLALFLIVLNSHHPVLFMGIFLFYMGFTGITRHRQETLKLRESLLVAFFLSGLVVLSGLQKWWLEPLIKNLGDLPLFLGTTALTAITDNAALTLLGSKIPNLSDTFKYALVAGAVTGGGLTLIANAPNPAGYAIFRNSFGSAGFSALNLFLAAAIPTLIAAISFWCY